MKNRLMILTPLALLGLAGCQTHLVFVEEDHVGLKAQFQPNNPSPAEFSLGYRRGIVSVIPQQSKNAVTLADPISVTWTTNTVKIYENPNELMSLYTVFKANVGFGSPTEVHHFMATGMAANALLANENDLRNVTTNLSGFHK